MRNKMRNEKKKRRLYTQMVLATCLFMLIPAKGVHAEDNTNDVTVEINEDNFPNEIFRQYVSDTIDLADVNGDKDGKLSVEEIAKVAKIDLKDKNIDDVKGIEYFTNLSELYLNNNKLTSIDISRNTKLHTLSLSNNQLTSIDISKNTNLLNLNLDGNQLSDLDVSNNTYLRSLNCHDNQLTDLDVSSNSLYYLSLSNNQLTNLDVSNNTYLESLFCNNNQLTNLDVSNNTYLERFDCQNNQLSSLDLTKNTALQSKTVSPQEISLQAVKDGDYYYIKLPNNVIISNIESVTGGETIQNGIILSTQPQEGNVISYKYITDANNFLMNVNITISGVRDISEIIADEEASENTTENETLENTTENETLENTTEISDDIVEEPTSVVTADTDNSVQTGDMNMPSIYILSGMAGLLGVILTSVIRKRDLMVKNRK